jgi:hypothetical protein
MEFKKLTVCAFMVIGVLGITPLCHAETSSDTTSTAGVQQETPDFLHYIETLNAYTVEQRDAVIHQTKAALDDQDKRIDALEAGVDENWDKMDIAAREKVRASLKALHKQRIKVAEWYGSLKSSTDDAWEHMKKGFSDAYMDLNDAWEKAEKEFGSSK